MKKAFCLAAITAFVMAASCAKSGPAEMKFTETEYDFGQINQGDKVDHTFKFTNSGTQPLVITNAKGSCGCTVPEYPKDSIQPGQSGEIKVIFNSAGKKGKQHKTVTLTTNTEAGAEILNIKGEVLPKAEATTTVTTTTTPAETK